MNYLEIDISKVLPFIGQEEIQTLQPYIEHYHKALLERTGRGNAYLGWVTLPSDLSPVLMKDILEVADYLKSTSSIVVVVGIGGSYLGAKAVIEAVSGSLSHLLTDNTKVLFAGHTLCSDYHSDLLKILDKNDYSVIVVSKSGTTTEPAIAFRLLREHLIRKYGHEKAKTRIVAVTDREKGALRKMALKEGYKSFIIPDDIGGRFSVLSPVGLLPVAVAGCDINRLVAGAVDIQKYLFSSTDINVNPAAMYAACRNALYRRGLPVEIVAGFHPCLVGLVEWWKQLFGESEGKQHRGIFPAGVSFTTDLHSLGQYIQDGMRVVFETVISVEKTKNDIIIPFEEGDPDGLGFTAGKTMQEVNLKAMQGTMLAHVDGGVPNIVIKIPVLDEYYLGQLIYMFEFACGLSAYLLDVNPFDQPGVEQYKKNMFALLGKPGFEAEKAMLNKRLAPKDGSLT